MPSLFFEGERCVLVAQAKGLYVHVILPTAKTDSEEEFGNQKSQLVVSNPATGAIKWLPRMLRHTSHGYVAAPCVHLEIVEAGAAAYGYRITCIQVGADVDGKERCVEVYDSRIGSWSVLEAPSVTSSLGNPGCLSLVPSVVHHGTVYFVAVSSWMCQSVVSFNLEDRKWRMVWWFRKGIDDTYRSIRLAVCDDKLVCVLLRNTKAACGGVIFVLDRDTKLPVHLPESQLTHQKLRGDRRPVGPMLGLGHHLYSLALEDGIMAAYDFRSKGWEEWPVSPVPYLLESTGTKLVDIQLGLLPSD